MTVPPMVPTIDISGWANPSDCARISAQLDDAWRQVGFLQIVGHPIPRRVIASALAEADVPFDLPRTEKLACTPARPEINRGYAAKGAESLSYSIGRPAPPDLFEAFNIGPDEVPDDEFHHALAGSAFARNVWPAWVPRLRSALTTYFNHARAVAHSLTEMFAVSLGLDAQATRRSMAFFHDGNDDAVVTCLPTCGDRAHPPKYPPTTAGAHLRAKLLGPRTLTESRAADTTGSRLAGVPRAHS